MSVMQQLLGVLLALSLAWGTAHTEVARTRNSLEYSITPSAQVAYYHYPVPSRANARQGLSAPYAPVQHYYQAQHPPQPVQRRPSNVVHQFTAPALEQAAFTQALSSQGYVFGSQATPAALTAVPMSRAIAVGPASATDTNSLNVKLPVPLGSTPLNVAQLPLQAGAPYSTLPRTTGLTSYGTPQVQRR